MTASKSKIVVHNKESGQHRYDKNITTNDGKTFVRTTHKFIDNKLKLNEPILIAGFPGPGLVGSIGTNYIIDKLNMHQIACIESPFITPGVIYTGGKLRHPFRLYANKQGNVCVLVCEAPIIIQGIYSVLDTVMKWSVNNSIKEVLVLEGIPFQGMPTGDRQPIILSSGSSNSDEIQREFDPISTDQQQQKQDKNNKIQKYFKQNTFIGGISGGLLSACLSNEIRCTVLLIPTSSGMPDPEGAAIIVESIGRVTRNKNLDTDARQLREQGTELKKRMEEIIRSIREQQLQQQGVGAGQEQQQQFMYG
jgi:uncharacterized protein